MKGSRLSIALAVLTLGISGCSTNQAIEDKMPQLQPGQGIAAVVIDTDQDISQVSMIPITGTGHELLIPSVPTGEHLYLFVAAAGTYCMHHFNAGSHLFDAKSDDQCFAVDAGKISYGGVYTPFVGFNFSLATVGAVSQDDDWDSFWKLMKATYPNIAASTAPPAPETMAKTIPPAPPPPSPTGICRLLNAEDASALLGVGVGAAQEDDSLIPTCTYAHSDQQAVHISTVTRGYLNGGTLDAMTPDHHYGWASFISIPNLGDEARYTYRGDTYQLLVLKKNKFVLLLTVESPPGSDMQNAMTKAAQTALSKF